MNRHAVYWLLGCVLGLMGAFLLAPAAVALYFHEYEDLRASLLSAALCAGLGSLIAWFHRGHSVTPEGRPDFFRREGLAVVGLSWLVAGVAGALPYLLTGTFHNPVDALFESVSGFTTTGSTVMSGEGIDGMSHTIAFWRSMTHWLGGIGIVLVFVVLFPTGGRSLYRSEVPGVSREAGHSRVRDSALALMKIYFGMSLLEFILLRMVGMTWFDSTLHTFGTLATGGFSNHSTSIQYFDSLPIEIVIGLFMFLAGVNFAIYDVFLRIGPRPAWRRVAGSVELRTYFGMVVGSSLLIACVLWFWGGSAGGGPGTVPDYSSFGRSIRDSFFTVVCLITSTGFATADFDQWPDFCRILLMLLAFVGAMAGSTGGGLKVVRFIIVAKAALVGVQRFARPRAIHSVRMDGQTLDDATVSGISAYFGLWVVLFLFGTLFVTASGVEPVTASTAVLATLNNIGPGLNQVGPTCNFAELSDPVKILFSGFMIVGRLEFYAVIVLFLPSFWRR